MGSIIVRDDFEWDEDKAASNLAKHNVSFEEGVLAVNDQYAIVDLDTSSAEERLVFIGMSAEAILSVVTVERRERTRIISARHASRPEVKRYQTEERKL
jgi:uncharacterized protein